jgi:dTDP-L-rhamnose 4-epimerase
VRRVLITGGAGFIGSHLADELLRVGDVVRVLDNLVEQVHEGTPRPGYLDPEVELQVGDIRDRAVIDRALEDVDAVVHLAARVGVGQSMYEIAEYLAANTVGTGVLLEAMLDRSIERLVVASSMSVYGEGLYATPGGNSVAVEERTREQLERREWDPRGPADEKLVPIPTPETKPPANSSVYALTKYDQERLCLVFGAAYGVPTVALRLFNVYGPHQALSNPYTGVLAIFSSRLLNDKPPLVYEDGEQRRDFVSVHDVARAFRAALESDRAAGQVINVGSGRDVSILEVAKALRLALGKDALEPEVTGRARAGDTRHCFADITRAKDLLAYAPEVEFERGIGELSTWLEGQSAEDRVEAASAELAARGLTL